MLQCTKTLENLAQQCNTLCGDKNAVYRQRRTFNTIFRKGKAWHRMSIVKRIREQKLQSSLVESLSEKKLINSVLFDSGCRPTWECRHSSLQSSSVASRYLSMR